MYMYMYMYRYHRERIVYVRIVYGRQWRRRLDAVYGKIMLTISIKFIAAPCQPAGEDDTACHHGTLSEYELKLRGKRRAGKESLK